MTTQIPLSSLSLFLTTPAQALIARERAGKEWSLGLTVQEYIDREVDGDTQDFAKDGKLSTWVLAPRDNPTTLDFFSSCKTFKRQIIVSHPSGRTTIETGYAIASVITPPQHRSHGYASHMMRLLHWVLAREEYLPPFPESEWGSRPERPKSIQGGVASVLWSGIGEEFYSVCGTGVGSGERDGWVVRDPFSVVWKVEDMVHETGELPEITPLDEEEQVEETWARDAERMIEELEKAASEENKAQFSFVPTGGVGAYLWHRLHYYTTRYVPDAVAEHRGVQMTSLKGVSAFATYAMDYRPGKPKTLIVTRLRADEDTIGPLVAAVVMYAKNCGMEEVVVWNLKEELAQIVGGRSVKRDTNLPSIKWYGPEEVIWKNNEWFCWC